MGFESVLGQVSLFAHLPNETLKFLGSQLQHRRFDREQIIFHKNDPGSTLYIIISGKVKILLPSPEGENVIVALLSTGEFFGELSLFDGAPRSATAVAAESTEILTLDKDDFNRYILENPKAALSFLAELSLRLRHTDELLGDAAFCNLATRLAKRLMELAHRYGQPGPNGSIRINMKLKQQDLADMSGATRESVNKVLKMFKAQRLIHWSKGIISLLDPAIMRRKAR